MPLEESDLVGQGRSGGLQVVFLDENRYQEKDHRQGHGQPELGRTDQRHSRSHVRISECRQVEYEDEDEIEDHAPPDEEVVEPGPVHRFQTALQNIESNTD